jgi:SEC-C motif-containing protein
MTKDCPCGSGLAYKTCCEPIIKGKQPAATAEALMRSRYTAYATGEIGHLGASLRADDRGSFDPESAKEWAESAQWNRLEIVTTERGGTEDADGIVEFKAHYTVKDQEQEHHERARFARENGRWVFVEGRVIGRDPYRREEPKVGRNDPCACGSGKKFKKCCGR